MPQFFIREQCWAVKMGLAPAGLFAGPRGRKLVLSDAPSPSALGVGSSSLSRGQKSLKKGILVILVV